MITDEPENDNTASSAPASGGLTVTKTSSRRSSSASAGSAGSGTRGSKPTGVAKRRRNNNSSIPRICIITPDGVKSQVTNQPSAQVSDPASSNASAKDAGTPESDNQDQPMTDVDVYGSPGNSSPDVKSSSSPPSADKLSDQLQRFKFPKNEG